MQRHFSQAELDRDWNDEFQRLYERPILTPFDLQQIMLAIKSLQNEFNAFCQKVASCINRTI